MPRLHIICSYRRQFSTTLNVWAIRSEKQNIHSEENIASPYGLGEAVDGGARSQMAGNSMQLNKTLPAKFIPTTTTPRGLHQGFTQLPSHLTPAICELWAHGSQFTTGQPGSCFCSCSSHTCVGLSLLPAGYEQMEPPWFSHWAGNGAVWAKTDNGLRNTLLNQSVSYQRYRLSILLKVLVALGLELTISMPLQLCATGHPHLQLLVLIRSFGQNKLTEKSISVLSLLHSSGRE